MPLPISRLVQPTSPLLSTSPLSPSRFLRLVAVSAGVISLPFPLPLPMASPMLSWALVMLFLVLVMRRECPSGSPFSYAPAAVPDAAPAVALKLW